MKKIFCSGGFARLNPRLLYGSPSGNLGRYCGRFLMAQVELFLPRSLKAQTIETAYVIAIVNHPEIGDAIPPPEVRQKRAPHLLLPIDGQAYIRPFDGLNIARNFKTQIRLPAAHVRLR